MATFRDLGPTMLLTAGPDTTQRNPGNWTIEASPEDLNSKVAQAEVYQISIDGPIGSSLQVWRNRRLWNYVAQGWSNVYDPVNPLYLRQGDSVFLFWNAAAAVWKPVPTATLWLRYDIDLPENKYGELS